MTIATGFSASDAFSLSVTAATAGLAPSGIVPAAAAPSPPASSNVTTLALGGPAPGETLVDSLSAAEIAANAPAVTAASTLSGLLDGVSLPPGVTFSAPPSVASAAPASDPLLALLEVGAVTPPPPIGTSAAVAAFTGVTPASPSFSILA